MDILIGPDRGTGFKIAHVWAALVVHDDTDEAVPAVQAPNGAWVPLIAADPARLDWLLSQAREIARKSGHSVRIVKFTSREPVETFHPDGRREHP
jgi:hypothetical protein